ncbi:hypothetical protein FPY71_11665 [Aureimonas fodinaquatilis]|uniref:DUF5330 domain-containing protein n=1 Tax=Aureimonas fodinaquatilis TaxID=2565783 RepID=A0A5B0DZ19_9HYPH|nr:DUF5330 domain-containing protein [Aureimonas fodinaquatilis]KAA0971095.1 hypothetical protein FPY71_11665 [Aureimonas fodinaquatilis]
MIRFIIKIAFWLGVIAFFLPGSKSSNEGGEINYFVAFAGFQELMSDMSGFCDRAPTACGAGGQIASFVGNRIGDGLNYGYELIRGQNNPPPGTNTPPASLPLTPAQNRAPPAGGTPVPAATHGVTQPENAIPTPSSRPGQTGS